MNLGSHYMKPIYEPRTPVLDVFTGSGSTQNLSAWNANWSAATGWDYPLAGGGSSTEFQVSSGSNIARSTSGGSNSANYWNAFNGADGEAWGWFGVTGSITYPVYACRIQNPTVVNATVGYYAWYNVNATRFDIGRFSGSAYTVLASAGIAAPQYAWVYAKGTTIGGGYRVDAASDWVQLGPVTDSNVSGSGSVGIAGSSAGSLVDTVAAFAGGAI